MSARVGGDCGRGSDVDSDHRRTRRALDGSRGRYYDDIAGGGARRERAAVEWTWTVDAEGREVLAGRVTDVTAKAVLRIRLVELPHDLVAMNLRDDRRRGNRVDEGIAVPVSRLRHVDPWNVTRIDDDVIGDERQRLERESHRLQPRLIDVHTVDLQRLDDPETDADRALPNFGGETLAGPTRQLLRVGDPLERPAGREHDRRGDDGPRERAHADLVDAGDARASGVPQQTLDVGLGHGSSRRPAPHAGAPPEATGRPRLATGQARIRRKTRARRTSTGRP